MQNLEKEFVPYDSALRLKNLGFDEPCLGTLDEYGSFHIKGTKRPPAGAVCTYPVPRPTYSQAFRWFREKYGYIPAIIPADLAKYEEGKTDYMAGLYLRNPVEIINLKTRFDSYEEATLVCLEKLIELIEKTKS